MCAILAQLKTELPSCISYFRLLSSLPAMYCCWWCWGFTRESRMYDTCSTTTLQPHTSLRQCLTKQYKLDSDLQSSCQSPSTCNYRHAPPCPGSSYERSPWEQDLPVCALPDTPAQCECCPTLPVRGTSATPLLLSSEIIPIQNVSFLIFSVFSLSLDFMRLLLVIILSNKSIGKIQREQSKNFLKD